MFDKTKPEYEKALKDIGYDSVELKYNQNQQRESRRNRNQNIIWFNPPFSRTVSTNVAKRFLNLLDHHFPKTNKLSKIFNRNTIKVSYCCTESMASAIKSHNKKLTIEMNDEHLPCNCRAQYECLLDAKCRAKDVVYKCVASTSINPDKVYLGTTQGEFKKRFYNHKKSFKNRGYASDTSLSKYIWEMKDKHNETPTLKWSIIKSVPAYYNISKKCALCLQEKFEIINHENQSELLNKRSEMFSKCRHANKFLLANYKAND